MGESHRERWARERNILELSVDERLNNVRAVRLLHRIKVEPLRFLHPFLLVLTNFEILKYSDNDKKHDAGDQ